jgi:diguanylate cyclase (GGDEF)-like protein
LPNHRALIARFDQELERAQRYDRVCFLLFLDLDHFKALNDGYGHTVGDAVLCELADLVRSQLRGMDTAGRWGGEEFIVILPELSAEDALHLAEEIRTTVATHTFHVGGGLHLTCSVGLASYPVHAQEREGLLRAAEQAMYAAKRFGRNQVREANDPAIPALFTARPPESGREETALVGAAEALVILVAEEAIPFGARILMVVDAYLTMIMDRPYRKACAPSSALAELRRCASSRFDPQVVVALTRLLRYSAEGVE